MSQNKFGMSKIDTEISSIPNKIANISKSYVDVDHAKL